MSSYSVISGQHRARQFEYHKTQKQVLFGTVSGDMCVAATDGTNDIKYLGNYGNGSKFDSILGLCWLRRQENVSKFVVGSDQGNLTLGDCSLDWQAPAEMVMTRKSIYSSVGSVRALGRGTKVENCTIVKEYEPSVKLTSVSVNCNDDFIVTSGYTKDVKTYDIETGQIVACLKDAHKDHINITRFMHTHPCLYATCSFDKTVKLWDLRQDSTKSGTKQIPIYTHNADSGLVMIAVSPCDSFILCSAVDNEIRQIHALDGRDHCLFSIPRTGKEGNFSRASYSQTGNYVLVGASEEKRVRMLCSASGEVVSTTNIYGGAVGKDESMYCQSLRNDPTSDNAFSVLVGYKAIPERQIVNVNLDFELSATKSAQDSTNSKAGFHKKECLQDRELGRDIGRVPWDMEVPKAEEEVADVGDVDVEIIRAKQHVKAPSPQLRLGLRSLRRKARPLTLRNGFSSSDNNNIEAPYVDVLITLGPTQRTYAHRFILAARCPLLCSLLRISHSHSHSSHSSDSSGAAGEGRILSLDDTILPYDPLGLPSTMPNVERCASTLSLFIDFLYYGNSAGKSYTFNVGIQSYSIISFT